jgi:hypothetical protein
MGLENSLKLSEPPKVVKEYIGWELLDKKNKKIFTAVFACLEIASIQALAMIAIPPYNEFVWDKLINTGTSLLGFKNTPVKYSKDISAPVVPNESAIIENAVDQYKQNLELEENFYRLEHVFNEAGKEVRKVIVRNERQLRTALKEIDLMTDEEKKDYKFIIEIEGEIKITEDTIIQAQGKQPTERNKYVQSSAGIVLPEGVSIKLQGNDKTKDKLVFSNQKISIYGQNLGDITISNLSISRNGKDEQEFIQGEMLRGVIFLATKTEGVLTQANISNVNIVNNIHIPKTDENYFLLPSGITTSGFHDLRVSETTVEDFYWDSVASFDGANIAITDSKFSRNKENYISNVGDAVVLITEATNPQITINNSDFKNYLKYFGIFGNTRGTLTLRDVNVDNEIESGLYLVSSMKNIDFERLNILGKGLEIIVRGAPHSDGFINFIDSRVVINRGSHPDFADPHDLINVFGPDSAVVNGTSLEINVAITEEEENLLKKKGIPVRIYK